jgi:outer membrane receptor for ferrienterochelin and colicin
VVTADEMKRYGWRNLGDILRHAIPNTDESNTLNYRQYGQRGFYSNGSNTLLMMDGREINAMSSGTVMIENWYLPQDIERVEVVMGPNSALYGSSALDGVINIVTKHGRETKDNLDIMEASTSIGDAGRYQYEGTYRVNRQDFSIGGNFSYFTGKQDWKDLAQFAVDTRNYRRSHYNTNASGVTVFNNNPAEFRMDEDTLALHLNMGYKDFYTGVNLVKATNYSGMEYAFYGFQDNHQNRDDTHIYTGWKHEFDNSLVLRLEYQHSTYNSKFLVITSDPSNLATATSFHDLLRVQSNVARNEAFEDKMLTTVDYQLGNHHLQAGFDWWTRYDRQGSISPSGATLPLIDEGNMYDSASSRLVRDGLYLQDSWQIIDQLKAVLGAHIDDERGHFQKRFTPRVALIWQPVANSVFEIGYGEGFRGPLAGEIRRNNAASGGYTGLQPMRMQMYEFSYNQLFKIAEGWGASNQLSFYDMKLADRIATTTGTTSSGVIAQLAMNSGGIRTQGFEDLFKVTSSNFSAFFGLRYINPERESIATTSTTEVIKWVPRLKTQMGVSYKFFNMVEAAINADYWSKVKTPANVYNAVYYAGSGNPTEIYTIDDRWVANLNFNFGEFKLDKFDLLFSVYINNLFNTHYYEACWSGAGGSNPIQFMQLPRNYWFTAKVKF